MRVFSGSELWQARRVVARFSAFAFHHLPRSFFKKPSSESILRTHRSPETTRRPNPGLCYGSDYELSTGFSSR